MDLLEIKALKIATRIGVYEWEQQIQQHLFIDISIPRDFAQCQDDLKKTLDYAHLCHRITDYVETSRFFLIETVAEKVAQLIQNEFQVQEIKVTVSKPLAIKNAADVRVTVHRLT